MGLGMGLYRADMKAECAFISASLFGLVFTGEGAGTVWSGHYVIPGFRSGHCR